MSALRPLAIAPGSEGVHQVLGEHRGKPSLDEVMEALDGRITSENDKRVAFRCPLHDDGNASGSLTKGSTPGDPDSYSVHCYGCDGDDGDWFRDFCKWVKTGEGEGSWSSKERTSTRSRSQSGESGSTHREYDTHYDYLDIEGCVVARKIRWYVCRLDPDISRYSTRVGKTFTWERQFLLSGSKAPLYRLPEITAAIETDETVWVVEGEKDAETMASIGLCGTTAPNGANPWTPEQIEMLRDARVVLVADRDWDGKGLKHARTLYWQLVTVCKSVELKIAIEGFKDVTEIFDKHGSVLEYLEEVPIYRPHVNPLTMTLSDVTPKYLMDEDGNCLFYPGEIHFVYGPPQSFKSLLTLELNAPYTRVLDFENGPAVIRQRLLSMNASPAHTAGFDFPETAEQVKERVAEYIATKPKIVIIDGLPGLCGVLGLDSDNNADIQRLFSQYLVPMKNAGICVVILDHIPKDAAKPEYPIGAQAKKAQAGVAYYLHRNPSTGNVEIFVAKDRHHIVKSRCEPGSMPFYGSLRVEESPHLRISIVPERVPNLNGQTMKVRDAQLVEEIYEYIEANPGSSKAAIEREVSGKNSAKRNVLKQLVDDGHVEVRQEGPAQCHYAISVPPVVWESREQSKDMFIP